MKLWLLRPITTDEKGCPWWGIYDCAYGFVVRAPTEDRAREMVAERPWRGDEGARAWLSHELSSCAELLPEGEEDVIIQDFHAG